MDAALEQRIRAELESEASRKTAPAGFAALPEIPAGRYTRADFAALEQEYVFNKAWLPAARMEELPKAGSYVVWRKLGPAILIVRGKDDVVRAFYNSCRHRGAALTAEDAGQGNLLRCQYHSWSYDLTGKLVGVPDEYDFCGLDKGTRALVPVKAEVWAGWVFVNLDPDAKPLAETVAPLAPEWACMEVEKLRVVHRRSSMINCNWKAAVDAFQEVYHITTIHQQSIGKALNNRACAIGLLPWGHSRMVTGYQPWALETLGMDSPDTPNIAGATELHRSSSTAYCLFPNVITPFRSIFVQFMMFWPRGVDSCEMQVVALAPDWGDGSRPGYWDKAAPAFDKVLDEDMANLGSIQASMQAGAVTGMLTSYQERRIYWTHEEIDRRIGIDRIPPELRVTPRLMPLMEQPR